MTNRKSLRGLLITLIVVYAASSLFDLGSRGINMLISNFGTPEIAIRYLEVDALFSTLLFAVLPLLLFVLVIPQVTGACRRAFVVLALGRGLVTLPYLLVPLFTGEGEGMVMSLCFTAAELFVTTTGLVLLACAVRSRELKTCGIIAAVAHALQSVMTLLSLIAGLMLTGDGYFRLWVVILSYSGIAGFLIGVAEGIVTALTFLMLLFALRESAAPAPVENDETQEANEHVSEND